MPVDARQIERAVEFGRARMESIADTISREGVGELIEELRHEAAPMLERAVERATGRRRQRSRKPAVALVILGLVAVAGVLAYLFWQPRDEEPAYLMRAPDEPDITPARMPPSAPSAGPSAGPSEPPPDEDEFLNVPQYHAPRP